MKISEHIGDFIQENARHNMLAKPFVIGLLNMGTSTINVKRCFGCASIIDKEELFCSYCRSEQ